MKSNLPTCREHLATGLKVALPAVDGQNVALEGRVKCRAIDKEAVPENMLFSGLSVASAAKYEVVLTLSSDGIFGITSCFPSRCA